MRKLSCTSGSIKTSNRTINKTHLTILNSSCGTAGNLGSQTLRVTPLTHTRKQINTFIGGQHAPRKTLVSQSQSNISHLPLMQSKATHIDPSLPMKEAHAPHGGVQTTLRTNRHNRDQHQLKLKPDTHASTSDTHIEHTPRAAANDTLHHTIPTRGPQASSQSLEVTHQSQGSWGKPTQTGNLESSHTIYIIKLRFAHPHQNPTPIPSQSHPTEQADRRESSTHAFAAHSLAISRNRLHTITQNHLSPILTLNKKYNTQSGRLIHDSNLMQTSEAQGRAKLVTDLNSTIDKNLGELNSRSEHELKRPCVYTMSNLLPRCTDQLNINTDSDSSKQSSNPSKLIIGRGKFRQEMSSPVSANNAKIRLVDKTKSQSRDGNQNRANPLFHDFISATDDISTTNQNPSTIQRSSTCDLLLQSWFNYSTGLQSLNAVLPNVDTEQPPSVPRNFKSQTMSSDPAISIPSPSQSGLLQCELQLEELTLEMFEFNLYYRPKDAYRWHKDLKSNINASSPPEYSKVGKESSIAALCIRRLVTSLYVAPEQGLVADLLLTLKEGIESTPDTTAVANFQAQIKLSSLSLKDTTRPEMQRNGCRFVNLIRPMVGYEDCSNTHSTDSDPFQLVSYITHLFCAETYVISARATVLNTRHINTSIHLPLDKCPRRVRLTQFFTLARDPFLFLVSGSAQWSLLRTRKQLCNTHSGVKSRSRNRPTNTLIQLDDCNSAKNKMQPHSYVISYYLSSEVRNFPSDSGKHSLQIFSTHTPQIPSPHNPPPPDSYPHNNATNVNAVYLASRNDYSSNHRSNHKQIKPLDRNDHNLVQFGFFVDLKAPGDSPYSQLQFGAIKTKKGSVLAKLFTIPSNTLPPTPQTLDGLLRIPHHSIGNDDGELVLPLNSSHQHYQTMGQTNGPAPWVMHLALSITVASLLALGISTVVEGTRQAYHIYKSPPADWRELCMSHPMLYTNSASTHTLDSTMVL